MKILWLFFFLFFSLYQYICIVEERERKRKKEREREKEGISFWNKREEEIWTEIPRVPPLHFRWLCVSIVAMGIKRSVETVDEWIPPSLPSSFFDPPPRIPTPQHLTLFDIVIKSRIEAGIGSIAGLFLSFLMFQWRPLEGTAHINPNFL